jgi:hypothetical protein
LLDRMEPSLDGYSLVADGCSVSDPYIFDTDTDPDPDLIRIQGFDDKKLDNLQLIKKLNIFLYQKMQFTYP